MKKYWHEISCFCKECEKEIPMTEMFVCRDGRFKIVGTCIDCSIEIVLKTTLKKLIERASELDFKPSKHKKEEETE